MPTPMRQPTPQSTLGILSNGNIRLDERIDLLDFLENEVDDGPEIMSPGTSTSIHTANFAHVTGSRSSSTGSTGSTTNAPHSMAPRSALQIALEAESAAALTVLTDDIPPCSPWYLQALFCLCFPTMGVEGTMRMVGSWMDTELRERVATCLRTLDRT